MKIQKSVQLIGTICGGLLMSLPAIPQLVMAQQATPKINPCPKIFYEEPHNNRVLVPVGCPPNALTQQSMQQGVMPTTSSDQGLMPADSLNQRNLGIGGQSPSALNPNPSIFNEISSPRRVQSEDYRTLQTRPAVQTPSSDSGLQPPAPEEQTQQPSARISLANGKANVMLINDTAADITYQVIGDTGSRTLPGKTSANLTGLNTPVTVTFQREDGGLLLVTPKAAGETGDLEVTMKETTDVNQDRSAMRIQSNGSVFLN
jgi:hypothetical protein